MICADSLISDPQRRISPPQRQLERTSPRGPGFSIIRLAPARAGGRRDQ